MFNAATRDSRDESGKMLPAEHCICNVRHKATLCNTHRGQQRLLFHKRKSMVIPYEKYKKPYEILYSLYLIGMARTIFGSCLLDLEGQQLLLQSIQKKASKIKGKPIAVT